MFRMPGLGPLVGAIDEGTSSARFILFRVESFEIVASYQKKISQIYPQEGWVEQDPLEILDAVITCINEAVRILLSKGGLVSDVVAVGITNQRESTIVWNKDTGEPLHNSIVWLDTRTSSTVDELLMKIPNNARNKNYLKPLCGLPLSPYFSAVKLKWLNDNIKDVKKAIKDQKCLFGTVDTWIIWNLTGGKNGGLHITDVTNASRTMLMNIDTLEWDPVLLNFFSLPNTVLPKIRSSCEIYGNMQTTSLKGIPIASCLGDQQAALVGQQCFNRGQTKATYGTGCFLLCNTGPVKVNSTHGLLTTVAYQIGKDASPTYAIEGSIAVAGACFSWLRDNLEIVNDIHEVQDMAEQAFDEDPSSDVFFVPAFSGLYAPYWQPSARGVICGITEETSKNQIVRAALEAVCFQTRDLIEAMAKDSKLPLAQLIVDGGMINNRLLMQILSDIIGIPVICPKVAETTSLGVALLAAVALGIWNLNKTFKMPTTIYTPKIPENERNKRYSKWKMAVERSMGWEGESDYFQCVCKN